MVMTHKQTITARARGRGKMRWLVEMTIKAMDSIREDSHSESGHHLFRCTAHYGDIAAMATGDEDTRSAADFLLLLMVANGRGRQAGSCM